METVALVEGVNATGQPVAAAELLADNATAMADQVSGQAPQLLDAGNSLLSSTLTMAAYLCLIIGVIILAFWLLKKLTPLAGKRGTGHDTPELLGRLMLGPRQSVAVVRVNKSRLVLGVTEQSIRLLKDVEVVDGTPGPGSDEEDEDVFTTFAEALSKKSQPDENN